MAFVISVVNTKGGVGKSTLSINLSEAYRRQGHRVMLIDHDFQQATTNRWKQIADAAGKETCRVVVAEGDLPRLVSDLGEAYDVIVIDAPGRLERATTTLIAVADLVLLPVQPNAPDLWTCESAIGWIEERQMITGGQPEARFVMSRCHADERVNREDTQDVAATGVPVLSSRTVQRVAYPRTMKVGDTVFDLPEEDKARGEILAIQAEIQGIYDVSSQSLR